MKSFFELREKLERDGPKMPDQKKFDRNFSKRASAHMSKHKASSKYLDKKVADRQALNKKNDPGGAKKGYALSVLDREKANVKYAKKKYGEAYGDGEHDLAIGMHNWKQGRDRQRAAKDAGEKAKANKQARRDAYAKRKAELLKK